MNISPMMWWGTMLEGSPRSERAPGGVARSATAPALPSLMDSAGFEPVIDEHLARYYPRPPGRFSALSLAGSSPHALRDLFDLIAELRRLSDPPPIFGAIIVGAPDTPLGNLRSDGSISLSFHERTSLPISGHRPAPAVIRDELRHTSYLAVDRRESYQLERHLWFSLLPLECEAAPIPAAALSPPLSLSEFIDLQLGSRLSPLLKSREINTGESLLRATLGVISLRWRDLELTAHHDRIIKKELILHRNNLEDRLGATTPWAAENTSLLKS